ncbi:Uncharacterised protein [Mycobacteroides abscessus subsp. abscessus]|nr:Uncharacterised protein [Mycobacteroides abscessus subsp. abscessus]
MTLLILWEPVWFRSSRLRKIRAPARSLRRAASVSREGRLEYSRESRWNSSAKAGSALAFSKVSSSSSIARISDSAIHRPP